MAIKISNTIVVDNSRNLVNANSAVFTGNSYVKIPAGTTEQRTGTPENGMIRYNTTDATFEGYAAGEWGPIGGDVDIILTPTNVSPANGAVGVTQTNPILEGSPYYHLYGKPKANGQWQISVTSDFSSTIVNATVSGNAVTYTTSVNLDEGVKHFWRVRYQDSDGTWSNFSAPTEFTTFKEIPTTLGQSYKGGFYTGVINIGGGTCYYLIVAPNATGCASCQWKTTSTSTPGATSLVNGYTNTYGPMNNADHPAGNFTATRTISGYSDWYMPARDELNIMFTNRGSMPSGEGFPAEVFWSSTECNATNAFLKNFVSGIVAARNKTGTYRVRAVRREPV